MKKDVILTVGITTHSEGLIAHKTMRSVFEALALVKEKGYEYEIIVNIDNGTQGTIDYFKRYENEKDTYIYKNKFGDTGPSRNFIAEKANGKYVAFLDGDDLISRNWYVEAIELLETANEEIVVHPEAILTFGIEQPNVLTLQCDSYGEDRDALVMLGENRWGSAIIAKKDTLLKVPYRKVGGGYGHEDYILNVELIENGIIHRIAKGTTYFYRRSENSRLAMGQSSHAIIPYMNLFDFERIRKIEDGNGGKRKEPLKNNAYRLYKKMRNNDVLNYFITPVAKATLKVINYGKKGSGNVPKFVIDAWCEMNNIDSQLYPYANILKKVGIYKAEEHLGVGITFHKIAKTVTRKPDYVLIVPWVVRGGADKVIFNYIKALKEIHPKWHFTVIATLPAKNTWAKRLPEYVDFIDFGNLAAGLFPNARDVLFSRIITQLDCKKLHIINSEYGYDWVRRHKELIASHYDLFVSLFMWEYIPASKMTAKFSYDNPYLFEIYNVVKKVFTDNHVIVDYTVENNGYIDADKIKVHYQPIENMKIRTAKRGLVTPGKLRILWAGRVVPIKLPDLVVKIGEKLDPEKFEIDVFGEMDKEVGTDIFNESKVVHYKGAYEGFDSLPTESYDLLLYTSLSDGMPNVILEATSAGLPIVASNDGGVGEFIQDNKTGVLIKDYLKAEPYVEALNKILDSPECLEKYAKNAQKLLNERHSWEKFVETVKEDIG